MSGQREWDINVVDTMGKGAVEALYDALRIDVSFERAPGRAARTPEGVVEELDDGALRVPAAGGAQEADDALAVELEGDKNLMHAFRIALVYKLMGEKKRAADQLRTAQQQI